MATLVTDPFIEDQIRAERARCGGDRYDEVWEGTYMMTPLANLEHQHLVIGLTAALYDTLTSAGLGMAYPGANVSDRETGWEKNYRCPDVVAVLNGSIAKPCDTHFSGGPDFLIEIVSPDDRSRAKLAFYGRIGVRELLIVDRDPWSLELYELQGDQLELSGRADLSNLAVLKSNVVRLSFRLVAGATRPQIEVLRLDSNGRWII
ncbi:MAG TPA: Uma2 family endonuclease [Pirellulales bacterium]|nr:Uma2 family endonuclease [Pirellulales bacterium]